MSDHPARRAMSESAQQPAARLGRIAAYAFEYGIKVRDRMRELECTETEAQSVLDDFDAIATKLRRISERFK